MREMTWPELTTSFLFEQRKCFTTEDERRENQNNLAWGSGETRWCDRTAVCFQSQCSAIKQRWFQRHPCLWCRTGKKRQ